jgi:predicted nucleotidyltransferase component of viral defense system
VARRTACQCADRKSATLIRYVTPQAFDRALVDRLRDISRTTGASPDQLRTFVAFDRLLARLNALDDANFVVKGGVALEYRMPNTVRRTNDLDLAMHGFTEARDALRAATSVDIGDHFTTSIVKEPTADKPIIEGVSSYRWGLHVNVGQKQFSYLTIDVGIEETSFRHPDTIEAPNFLAFAGLPTTCVRVIPVVYHLAEKLHAYTRTYAANRPSSRVKDLVDMVLIARNNSIASDSLRDAIIDVFSSRSSLEVPRRFVDPPAVWHDRYAALIKPIGIDEDMAAGASIARELFDGALARSDERIWDPAKLRWDARELHRDQSLEIARYGEAFHRIYKMRLGVDSPWEVHIAETLDNDLLRSILAQARNEVGLPSLPARSERLDTPGSSEDDSPKRRRGRSR